MAQTKVDQRDLVQGLVEEMRTAFDQRDWDKALTIYERVSDMRGTRALRLEASCLAARAFAAAKQRSAARAVLRKLSTESYRKPVHYEFLARAYLDLKQYKNAAEACERAEELRAAEGKTA